MNPRPLASRFSSSLAVSVVIALAGPAAAGEIPDPGQVQIHLITMSDSADLFTSGGHSALLVAQLKNGEPDPAGTTTYNFGSTDWDDPYLVPNFFLGKLTFFLTKGGTLADTISDYGLRQGRETWRQRLNLTDAQAKEVARRLEVGLLPENRNYRYHHNKALCTTRIRDLLDEVLGGALHQQLAAPSGYTVRDLQAEAFRNHTLVAVGADLISGRASDLPLDKYAASFIPRLMRDYFQEVLLPNPSGSGPPVPLAEPPNALTEVPGGSPPVFQSRGTLLVAVILLGFLAFLGTESYRRMPKAPQLAGSMLMAFSAGFGLIGLVLATLAAVSQVPEFRGNENVLCFLPTDWVLLPQAWRWRRGELQGGKGSGRFLRYYTSARLALALLVVALHAVGILYQQPSVLCLLSLGFGAMAFALVRRSTASSSAQVLA